MFVMGYRHAKEAAGAIIFYLKRAFCSYLGLLWGFKTHRKTYGGMGRLIFAEWRVASSSLVL
jgi:hypothetical protein